MKFLPPPQHVAKLLGSVIDKQGRGSMRDRGRV